MEKRDSFRPGRNFLFRLRPNADILPSLTDFCARRKVRCAAVHIIGALSEACIGYYDQKSHTYSRKIFRQEMEIVSCSGNVSLKDGEPFLHLHAVLSDTKMRAWGGHLFPGAKIFAAEVHMQELLGPPRERRLDAFTGLALWPSCLA